MNNSGVNLSRRDVKNKANGHKNIQGKWIALGMDYSTRGGSGSMYSTVEDLYKWDRALYTNKLISEPLRQKIFTPQMKNYGYGWHIEKTAHRKLVGHGGYVLGFSSEILRDTSSKNVVILLSNHGDEGLDKMAEALLSIIEQSGNHLNEQTAKKPTA
jgi:CubicO group peptidase (beta-lactamase class C family)